MHSLYLKYIRNKIRQIKDVYDIIDILNNINNCYGNVSTDQLISTLIECFNKYPLSDYDLQKISLLQQKYDNTLDIENYASFLLWMSCIQYIIDNK